MLSAWFYSWEYLPHFAKTKACLKAQGSLTVRWDSNFHLFCLSIRYIEGNETPLMVGIVLLSQSEERWIRMYRLMMESFCDI